MMNLKSILIIFFSGLFGILTGCKQTSQDSASKKQLKEKPNIVLVMADDQGWGDVGYQGHPTLKTPHLDDLANDGLRFNQFYASAPVCSPTRASFLTGRHPNRIGAFRHGGLMRPQEKTLAEALKKAGYATAQFGKWHIGSVYKGCPTNPGANGFDEWLSAPNYYDNNPILSHNGIAEQKQGESSIIAVDAAIEFMEQQLDQSNPFLSVIWFGSPHHPHQAIARDQALYPEEEEDIQNFYGEITGIDRAVGKLRKKLESLGIKENTILWYLSDNGGLRLGWDQSTGGRGKKGQIYEGGLRVPSIIEWPARISEPRQTNVPAVVSDIYPTLLEITGVEVQEQPVLDGISLVPLIENEMKERSKAIGFWHFPAPGRLVWSNRWMKELWRKQHDGESVDSSKLHLDAAKIDPQYEKDDFRGHAAWLDWPFKLHRIEKGSSGEITIELYNLEKDPLEENDLSTENTSKAETMRSQLEQWQQSVMESYHGEDFQ